MNGTLLYFVYQTSGAEVTTVLEFITFILNLTEVELASSIQYPQKYRNIDMRTTVIPQCFQYIVSLSEIG